MIWDAVVIGGGCAGLSAATQLASEKYQVLVVERKRFAGGRASSFLEKNTGEEIDNGQHLMLGCYASTLAYLQRIGGMHLLKRLSNLGTPIAGDDGSMHVLQNVNLPAPLNLLMGLLSFKALSLSDRLKFLKLPFILTQKNLHNVSAYEWLQQLNQTPETYERFWEILILATLNADPKKIAADQLSIVLKDGFMSSKRDSEPLLSTVGLTELFGKPAETYLTQRGGKVLYQSIAQKFILEGNHVQALELFSGERLQARCFISSLPPDALNGLAEKTSPEMNEFSAPARRLQPSPILSLNLWTPNDIITAPYAGMWGTKFHWVFRKDRYFKNLKHPYYTLVASAASALLTSTKEALIELARRELKLCFGKDITVSHATLSWEKYATWVAPLGDTQARLDQKTPWKNFFLCGDWTKTQLPGTIESAFKSGDLAAQHASHFLG